MQWRCRIISCERKVFTECLPTQIPARARITTRARRRAEEAIGDHTRLVSDVAAEFGIDWRIAHDTFVAHAAAVLPEAPPPLTVLGVDETRRGNAHDEIDPATGAKTWVDRFDTGLVDLGGDGGLFAQVNGRTSKVLVEWLQAQDPDWLARITPVSMDTSATYARAARLALPNAVVVVDRFIWSPWPIGRSPSTGGSWPGPAAAGGAASATRNGRNGNRLLRAAETLTPDELAKVQDAMRRADPSGGLEKCWKGKELLRTLLKLAGTNPDRGRIVNALTAFYLYCADSEVALRRRLA
jgi:hypothetical protein